MSVDKLQQKRECSKANIIVLSSIYMYKAVVLVQLWGELFAIKALTFTTCAWGGTGEYFKVSIYLVPVK